MIKLAGMAVLTIPVYIILRSLIPLDFDVWYNAMSLGMVSAMISQVYLNAMD